MEERLSQIVRSEMDGCHWIPKICNPGDLLKANHVDLERFGKGTVGDPGQYRASYIPKYSMRVLIQAVQEIKHSASLSRDLGMTVKISGKLRHNRHNRHNYNPCLLLVATTTQANTLSQFYETAVLEDMFRNGCFLSAFSAQTSLRAAGAPPHTATTSIPQVFLGRKNAS